MTTFLPVSYLRCRTSAWSPACLSRSRPCPLPAYTPARSALVDLSLQRLNLRPAFLQLRKSLGKPRAVFRTDARSIVQSRAFRQLFVQFVYKPLGKPWAVVCPNARSLVHPQAVVNPVISPDNRSLAQLLAVLRKYSVARPVAQSHAVYQTFV